MRSTLPTCFLIGLTVIACGRRDRERGLGAGADSTGIRDTSAVSPTPPSSTPSSATDSAVKARTSKITGDTTKGRTQTQSGVTDKSGRSKSRKPGGSITDSLNRKALERWKKTRDTTQPESLPTDTTHQMPSDT